MSIVEEFEKLLESYYPNTKAIAVNSGTSALIACLKSLNLIHRGFVRDDVITSPFTFQATSDAILLAGGCPIFADINETTHLIEEKSIRKHITADTKAIVPVNLFGRLYDSYIAFSCNKFPIIEDSAQAFLHPDNFAFVGDAQCFSFHRSKNCNCGEGGAIVVKNNGKLDYEYIWSICNNGRLPGKPKHEYYNVGYNFRMSEHQALIVYNQLKYHPKSIQSELGVYDESSGYYPRLVYQQPSYQRLGIKASCPVAEKVAKEVLTRG